MITKKKKKKIAVGVCASISSFSFFLSCKSFNFYFLMALFCTCDFFHNVKFMANKHKSFFLLTVNALCLLCFNATGF